MTASMLDDHSLSLGFIGAGNMAQAIIGSMLKAGVVTPQQVTVSAPSDTHLAPLRARGITTTHDNAALLRDCDAVLLCVKPHMFVPMLSAIKSSGDAWRCRLFISVMAGLPITFLQQALNRFGNVGVIRAMPNTPSLVFEGCCAYACAPGLPADLSLLGSRLLACLGLVREVPESQINAVAAVAGSGPAYFYIAIEAMADAGVKMGLPRELAQALAAQTLRGAACMVQQTGRHPGQLKDEVCAPGGTTIAAVHQLEKNGFRNALICAVEAGTIRAEEMAKQQEQLHAALQ